MTIEHNDLWSYQFCLHTANWHGQLYDWLRVHTIASYQWTDGWHTFGQYYVFPGKDMRNWMCAVERADETLFSGVK